MGAGLFSWSRRWRRYQPRILDFVELVDELDRLCGHAVLVRSRAFGVFHESRGVLCREVAIQAGAGKGLVAYRVGECAAVALAGAWILGAIASTQGTLEVDLVGGASLDIGIVEAGCGGGESGGARGRRGRALRRLKARQ